MPLILAIEPDRHRAAQLTALIHRHIGAELILANMTEAAISAIGTRIPDLILVPALLSPQDDAALAAALRVIATAAHVQMLTIPVLAAPQSKPAPKGVFSVLRREKPRAAAADGCDPLVFAEQIAAYLNRAAEERADEADAYESASEAEAAAEFADAAEPTPQIDPAAEFFAADEPAPAIEAVAGQFASVVETPVEFALGVEPAEEVEGVEEAESVEQVEEPEQVLAAQAAESVEAAEADPWMEPGEDNAATVLDLSDEIEAMDEGEGVDEEQDAIELGAIDFDFNVFEADAVVVVPPAIETGEPNDFNRDLSIAESRRPGTDTELWMAWPAAPGVMWPRLGGGMAEARIIADFVAAPPPPKVVAPPRAAKTQQPEWTALIESLRQDIERFEVHGPRQAPSSGSPVAHRDQPVAAAHKRRSKQKDAQDEWGFFDPAQCGFSALLAKLEEVTTPDDEHDTSL